MWWTDRPGARALASALALTVAGVVSGCTTPLSPAGSASPLTPTEQYTVQVEQVPDQLALTAHPTGLSVNQRAAAAAFVGRWRESGRADVSIRTPEAGDGQAIDRTASDLLNLLLESGIPGSQVRVASYDTAGVPGAPILASFDRYEARGPNCEGGWDNLTSTGSNKPSSHFGCAVTANFAAMIADPRDLLAPAPGQPSDAVRRATVLQRYRAGEVTSSARDEQAAGTVSNAVN
jgi:pilus assembly protein CpaD